MIAGDHDSDQGVGKGLVDVGGVLGVAKRRRIAGLEAELAIHRRAADLPGDVVSPKRRYEAIAVKRVYVYGRTYDEAREKLTAEQAKVDRICEDSGIRRVNVHALLKKLGVPPKDAQVILGHANAATTNQIYTHVDDEAKLDARAKLNRLLGGGDD